jgi:carbonic anhydrase
VIDNGHTVQVNMDPGNSITVQGRRYDLVQFHFHRPSEERINGRQFEMVAHLVHKDPEGRLAVVAVLLDLGSAHPVVQQVWNSLPLEKNIEQYAPTMVDLNMLLPEQRQYYTYMGSLTTPPCSEGVLWMVLKQPATISRDQISIFSRLYPMNARPIQSGSGRLIKDGQ